MDNGELALSQMSSHYSVLLSESYYGGMLSDFSREIRNVDLHVKFHD